ncbi:MAG: TlpA family protein disulfide reductase [Gemmatimonadota bacterium]|nr:TlpA family protein disulfide reductase [Gemmatimonadota bacterium]
MSSRARPEGWRRWLNPWTLILLGVWIFVLVRLGPHLGAVVGIRSGEDLVPSFRYATLAGDTVSSTTLRGKVVLVNFWATWCPPCKIEMPLLQSMAARHAGAGLVVLGLSRDRGPASDVKVFLSERGITYPVAIVGREAEQAFGGVRGYPTSFLLDRSGRIRHAALGPLAMVSFEPAVRRLLAEAPDSSPVVSGVFPTGPSEVHPALAPWGLAP